MAKIAITGGGGMIGQKIARRLMDEGFGGRPVDKLSLINVAFPESSPANAKRITGSLANAKIPARIAAERPFPRSWRGGGSDLAAACPPASLHAAKPRSDRRCNTPRNLRKAA